MKRVTSSSYNIEKVCDVNQISRQLVGGQIDLETAFKQLKALQAQPLPYTKLQVTLAATFSAPFFSIMFSGNIYDALGAGVATLFGFAFSLYVEKFIRIPFVTAFAGAFVFGMIAQFLGSLHRFSFNGRFDYSWCSHAFCTRNCLDKCGSGYHD